MLNKNNNLKILLTDGNYKHTWAAARALSTSKYTVDVIGGERSIASKSKHVRKNVFNSNSISNGNLNNFLELLKIEKYMVVLGIGASSIKFLSDNRSKVGKYTKLLLPSKKALEICLDKNQTMKFASANKVNTPRTFSFTNKEDISRLQDFDFFPIIVKNSIEIDNKISTLYISSKEEFRKNLERQEFLFNGGFMAQERIFGTAEAFFAIYDHGVLIDCFMHERLRENPITGGPSTKARSIYKQDLYKTGKTLLDKLAWHGVAMVEFKRDINGELYLMEINPKFWGSLDLAIAAGVNFPDLAVKIAQGKKLKARTYHAKEKIFQWPLDGDIWVGFKNPKLLPNICIDLINLKINKNIYLNDLSPSINTVINKIIAFFINLRLFYAIKSLAYKINSHGIKIGIIRWITEVTGIPLLKYSKINKNIYIGARLSKFGVIYLKICKINSILNLQSENDGQKYRSIVKNYYHIPIVEFESPAIKSLKDGTKFIKNEVEKGESVYIHCAEGVGRAPTMAVAYLMLEGYKISDAIKLVSKNRPFINILDSQLKSLKNL